MYSVPFCGESSFLMYRKDLLEQAGITLGTTPTWSRSQPRLPSSTPPTWSASACAESPAGAKYCPLDTVINTFGGRWYDEKWNAQLSSPEVTKAVEFYVDLVMVVDRTRRS